MLIGTCQDLSQCLLGHDSPLNKLHEKEILHHLLHKLVTFPKDQSTRMLMHFTGNCLKALVTCDGLSSPHCGYRWICHSWKGFFFVKFGFERAMTCQLGFS